MAGRVYLDWAAGAPLHPAASAALVEALQAGPGNPASVHGEGRAARSRLERARAQIAALSGATPRDVRLVGSGTEANALAVLGLPAPAAGGAARLLVGATEHPSVHLAARAAAARGASVEPLPVDGDGVLRLDELQEALQTRADLVAVQLVNNETGVIQPVAAIAALCRQAGVRLHVDAVQAAGKLDLAEAWHRADSVALSAHKLGGPPGVGALLVRRGVALGAVVPGHQEDGLRGGTPPLHLIAAFGAAAAAAATEREARAAALRERTTRLEQVLRSIDPTVRVQGAGAARAPGIVSATFPGADGETLLVALDLAGISASHGAACAAGALEPSHVLRAMGLERDAVGATVRFSPGPSTGDDELERLGAALPDALRAARAARGSR